MPNYASNFVGTTGGPIRSPQARLNFVATFSPRVGDLSPPVLDQVSPAVLSTITRTQALSFRLRDASAFAIRELYVRFGDADAYEIVHDGSTYRGNYLTSSVTPLSDGFVFTLKRTGGWPSGLRVQLHLAVVDAGGNVVVINA